MNYNDDEEEIDEVEEEEGCFNTSADKVTRINATWSDTNLDHNFELSPEYTFERLVCRNCGRTDSFEVLVTGSYETSARCRCGMYYIVHSG